MDVEQQGERLLREAFQNTVDAMENSKGQIFEIYENTKNDVEAARVMLKELKEETAKLQDEVDVLVHCEQQEKQRLVKVSSNFANYSEDKIRASYEAVKDVQVRLALVKEKEFQSRRQRDRLEIRLRGMEQTLLMAERLATKLGTVVGYLTSQISNVVAQMDIASKNKFLGVQIIKAQEDERLRVSREIHDGPAQEMANLIYQASICERLVDTRPEEAKAGLQELRRQIRTCLADVRQIIFDMRPMSLDDLGLVPALRQLVSKLEERKILKTDFQVNGKERALEKHVEVTLFRIIQEGLNNIHRHAGVSEGRLRLLFSPNDLSILISDEGRGFDMAETEEMRKSGTGNGHFGILGMEERAKLIGASLNVISNPGEGTKIHVKLPYPKLEKD
ncbi:MAG: sensor histidine kinase [Selenomonadaceae bacterium]|uniref:histidine kinase n=2 Tax=Anaerovibrio slackiae TaxID=2652309 RepID=A0A6I2UF71_9FIRM|nr:sensor histidine kinase [Selenomonadaceae bacterium]MSU07811.1 sensor histidine kinase [Anaerovibrio slackiae]MBQ5651644.1 sensor histidine kinase [Selenomonadaceae bacterium]MBQ5846340.1 sensor histidine kinase [Selenomonadaceae bacterium]MBQ5919680.1 sensor histidine kinase [Selenomonadaceae bacterium]